MFNSIQIVQTYKTLNKLGVDVTVDNVEALIDFYRNTVMTKEMILIELTSTRNYTLSRSEAREVIAREGDGKIPPIKLLKEYTSLCLKDCNDIYEAYLEKLNIK